MPEETPKWKASEEQQAVARAYGRLRELRRDAADKETEKHAIKMMIETAKRKKEESSTKKGGRRRSKKARRTRRHR